MCSVLKRKDDVLGIHDVLVGFKQLAVFQHLGDKTRNDRATAIKASCPSQKANFATLTLFSPSCAIIHRKVVPLHPYKEAEKKCESLANIRILL
jgi:hypothetical protein